MTTPGASWQRNGNWWHWRYPRADINITGRVVDDASWTVLVEDAEVMHSKVPAPSLKVAGHQCWRAMCRASTWNAPRVAEEEEARAQKAADTCWDEDNDLPPASRDVRYDLAVRRVVAARAKRDAAWRWLRERVRARVEARNRNTHTTEEDT